MKPDFSDVVAFVSRILAGELDACGVLADYLDERGDPRGRLLRLRWKRWRTDRKADADATAAKERAFAKPWEDSLQSLRDHGWEVEGVVRVKLTGREKEIDAGLLRYVRERFP